MERHLYILFLVIIIFVLFILFRYFSNDYVQYKRQNPYLINGLSPFLEYKRIPNSKITKSIDRRNGIEFTYTFWLKINNFPNDKKTIFYKGNKLEDSACPGVYIIKNNTDSNPKSMNTLNLAINLDTYFSKPDCDSYQIRKKLSKVAHDNDKNAICKSYNCNYKTGNTCEPYDCNTLNIGAATKNMPDCDEISYCNNNGSKCENKTNQLCIIPNIPFKKWFHVSIILMNHYLDVYINGNLYERFEIKGVVNQNDSDLIIGGDEPASASIMNLQYFNRAIPYFKISKMMDDFDTKNAKVIMDTSEDEPPYLGKDYWIGDDTLSDHNEFN